MGLAAVLKVQPLLRFGVRGECECSLQAKLAGGIVCLLLCLPLQATHCQLSVITFFFSLELSNWLTELCCHSKLFFSLEFAASAASLKTGTCRKPCLFPIWCSYIRFSLTLHTQLHCDTVPQTPNSLHLKMDYTAKISWNKFCNAGAWAVSSIPFMEPVDRNRRGTSDLF